MISSCRPLIAQSFALLVLNYACLCVVAFVHVPVFFSSEQTITQPTYYQKQAVTSSRQKIFSHLGLQDNNSNGVSTKENNEGNNHDTPHLIFPGGGIFFYWQAGVVTYLREQGYDLSSSTFTAAGASAGALTATLTMNDVDFYKATDLALEMSKEAGIWDRPEGLQGIWGPIIYDWLDELLPNDALDRVNGNGKLSLLVTPIPSFGKNAINEFESRKDLIECNMASVHLPWFLDGKLTATFRGRPHIDGSFLAKEKNYMPSQILQQNSNIYYNDNQKLIIPQLPQQQMKIQNSIIRLDWTKDPAYQSGSFFDFVDATSPDGIWNILEQGKAYARIMEEQGIFANLPKKQKKSSTLASELKAQLTKTLQQYVPQ